MSPETPTGYHGCVGIMGMDIPPERSRAMALVWKGWRSGYWMRDLTG